MMPSWYIASTFIVLFVTFARSQTEEQIDLANELSATMSWSGDASCSGARVFYQFFFLGSLTSFSDGVVKVGTRQFSTSANYSVCTTKVLNIGLLLDFTEFPDGGEVVVLVNGEYGSSYTEADFSDDHVIVIELGGELQFTPSASPSTAPAITPVSCTKDESNIEVVLSGASSDIIWSIFSILPNGATQELFSQDGLSDGSICLEIGEYALDVVDIADGDGIDGSGFYQLRKNGSSLRTGNSFNFSQTTRFTVDPEDTSACDDGLQTFDITILPDSFSDGADISWSLVSYSTNAVGQFAKIAEGSSTDRVCVYQTDGTSFIVGVSDSTGGGNADVTVTFNQFLQGSLTTWDRFFFFNINS